MSSVDAHPDRVQKPDPGLLTEAAGSIGRLFEVDGELDWSSGEPLQRPRSVVIPLEARDDAGRVWRAFFKRSYPPPYGEERRLRWEATVRSGLSRAIDLESRLADLAAGEGITFSRALATDPATMSVVTMAVPGRPLGRVWRHVTRRAARSQAIDLLRIAGRAAWLIEQCSPQAVAPEPGTDDAVERRVGRVRDLLPAPTLTRLEERMDRLNEQLGSSPDGFVYAHGDLSATNVLVESDGGIGLIDFTWSVRQRGFDLAHFAFRIEYDTAVPSRLTRPFVEALIEGYSDPDVVLRPGWQFVRLSKLLKVVEDGGGGRSRRAMAEIESSL
ncbi:MAG: phosphotransferase family protein [Acidimicrobiia bacterium]